MAVSDRDGDRQLRHVPGPSIRADVARELRPRRASTSGRGFAPACSSTDATSRCLPLLAASSASVRTAGWRLAEAENHLDRLDLAARGCRGQRRFLSLRAVLQQQPDDLGVLRRAAHRGIHRPRQRCRVVERVLDVHVGAALEEELHDLDVTAVRGEGAAQCGCSGTSC